MPTSVLVNAFLLFFLHAPILSDARGYIPTFKAVVDVQPAIIRGLIDLNTRQAFCPSPSFLCEGSTCCPNINWECCRQGGCCQPGTICVLASNGIDGCCPIGELCSGPVGNPMTTTVHFTTTRTHTSTIKPTPPAAPRTTSPRSPTPSVRPTTSELPGTSAPPDVSANPDTDVLPSITLSSLDVPSPSFPSLSFSNTFTPTSPIGQSPVGTGTATSDASRHVQGTRISLVILTFTFTFLTIRNPW